MPSADLEQRDSSPLSPQHDAPQHDQEQTQQGPESDTLSAQTLQDREAQTTPQVGLPYQQMPANTRGGFAYRAIQAAGLTSTPEQVLTGAAYQRIITRAEAASVIARLMSFSPALEGQPAVFNDVPISHWAAAAIYRCREEGFLSGAGQNQFMPDNPLLLEHAQVLLKRVTDPGARAAFDRDAALQEAQQSRPQKPQEEPAATPGAPDPNHKRTFTDAVYKKHDAQVDQADLKLDGHDWSVKQFTAIWEKNQARYEAVAAKTSIPAKLIAALHFRESSGSFSTYLHQGDPLGKPAVNWPSNIPVFYVWEDAAVHALNMKASIRKDLGLDANTTDMATIATFAEYYNGLGYHNKGKASPYVYSGTDQYDKGKYVRDGVYDAKVKDQQLGVLAMVKLLNDKQGTKPSTKPLGAPLDGQVLLDGQPVPAAQIIVRGSQGQRYKPGATTADGFFSVPGGLAAGTYQVEILGQAQEVVMTEDAPAWVTFNLNPAQIPQAPTPEAQPEAAASANPLNGKVLRKGAKGSLVTWLQERLTAHGQPVTADGDFGANTYKAVTAFQRANGLEVDGVVGSASANALAKAPAGQTPAPAQPAPAQQPTQQAPTQQAPTQQTPPQQTQTPADPQQTQTPADPQQTQTPAPQQAPAQPAFTATPDGMLQVHGLTIGPLVGVFQGRARAAIIGERLAAQSASALTTAALNMTGGVYSITVGSTFFQITDADVAAHASAFPKLTDRYRATASHILEQMGAPVPETDVAADRGAAAAKSARIEYKAGVREHGSNGSWETQGANKGARVNKFKAANNAGGNNSYAWCGMFVGYHFKQAGIREEILKNLVFWSGVRLNKFFNSGGFVATSQAKAGSWWQPHQTLAIGSATGATRKAKLDAFGPKPGDVALFRSDYSHVAIVTGYDPKTGKLELIEGNRGNRVQATVYDTTLGDVTFLGRFNESDFEPGGAVAADLSQADDPDVTHSNVSGGIT
jgi:lysozyme family protein/peptidoglycan hydrolase-like protein with peptidoglycan-binding domain